MDPSATPQAKESHPDKTLGYILLAAGIVLIIATLVWVFVTLSGKVKVSQVFNIEAPSIPIPAPSLSLDESALPPQLAGTIKQSQPQQQSIKLFSNEVFSTLLNMGVFYLLAMFVASTGAKIASIGVQLIKNPK